jgi:hypothetical protein
LGKRLQQTSRNLNRLNSDLPPVGSAQPFTHPLNGKAVLGPIGCLRRKASVSQFRKHMFAKELNGPDRI